MYVHNIYIYNFWRKYKIFVIWKKPSRFIYSLDETRIMHIAKEFQSKPKFYGQKIWERKKVEKWKKKNKMLSKRDFNLFLRRVACRGVQGSRETAATNRSRETTPHLWPIARAEADKRRPMVSPMPVWWCNWKLILITDTVPNQNIEILQYSRSCMNGKSLWL